MTIKPSLSLVLAAMASFTAAPALAQNQQMQNQQAQGRQQGQSSPDQDFASLHNALHISAQQEAAWAAYRAAAPSPEATEQRRNAAAQMFPTLTSPRRIDLVEAEMRQELAELQRQSAALKALYASFSPEQQRVFDERTLPPEQRH